MLEKIVCGGQPGTDTAAHRAAVAFEIASGGEHGSTEANVRDADATLWFGETTTPGAQATVVACQRARRPCLPLDPAAEFEPEQVARWIAENRVRTLHVAGNREDEEPGIGERVEGFLAGVLTALGHRRA